MRNLPLTALLPAFSIVGCTEPDERAREGEAEAEAEAEAESESEAESEAEAEAESEAEAEAEAESESESEAEAEAEAEAESESESESESEGEGCADLDACACETAGCRRVTDDCSCPSDFCDQCGTGCEVRCVCGGGRYLGCAAPDCPAIVAGCPDECLFHDTAGCLACDPACAPPACAELDPCACEEQGCTRVSDDCTCPADFCEQCGTGCELDCDCGGGSYLGCAAPGCPAELGACPPECLWHDDAGCLRCEPACAAPCPGRDACDCAAAGCVRVTDDCSCPVDYCDQCGTDCNVDCFCGGGAYLGCAQPGCPDEVPCTADCTFTDDDGCLACDLGCCGYDTSLAPCGEDDECTCMTFDGAELSCEPTPWFCDEITGLCGACVYF